MGFMTQVLFESPLWLGALSFLLFAVVLLTRMRWESETARRYALPGILLLIILLFVMQKLVVTQREEVRLTLDHFVTAIEQEDLAATSNFISPDFQTRTMDREGLVTWLEFFFEVWSVRDARIYGCTVNVGSHTAQMTFNASATASRQGAVGQSHLGSWRVDWVRETGAWRILSLQTLTIDSIKVETLSGVPGQIP
ncbi:MAG: hypothetical protein MI923_14345 [Phycisphaerales bacterium]|nr:hypothetical protein [Phycisphaerales bacterium]